MGGNIGSMLVVNISLLPLLLCQFKVSRFLRRYRIPILKGTLFRNYLIFLFYSLVLHFIFFVQKALSGKMVVIDLMNKLLQRLASGWEDGKS